MSKSEERRTFPAWRWVLAAATAGALAGAAVVYASRPASDNAGAELVSAADAACAAKAEQGKAITATATGQVAALMAADPPVSLADVRFEAPDGKPLAIEDFGGKVLLVNLWATWCAPCRAEMPALDQLQREKGGAGFEVVAINTMEQGGPEKPNKFLDEIGVSALARYRDSSRDLFEALKARGLALGLPATFLLDREGCLLALMNGPAEWSSPDAFRVIDVAIAG
ncbi:MAG TPA: TlpA disulfide reductase family protein [Mesorhizobium sp.]|jgi:thiol-disulfide isomerase/thioredoxin|nr:TlpA disulfide reductase family protein [Mesorhizobium sp.]